jgi:hypothetical protein
LLRNLRSLRADGLAFLVQDFFLDAPTFSNSTLLGRVAGEERTRGEGLFEEWRVASLMPAANGPSPVARLGSLPTLPRRVDCCATCGRCLRMG